MMEVKELAVQDIYRLTELFDYNDVDAMISEWTCDIQNNVIDIFVLMNSSTLVGELHAMYQADDENYAVRGKRAYLFAFRIHKDYQGKGYGKYLLQRVLDILKDRGYYEFTVGVEDDNLKAQHIYQSFGFNEMLLRKQEEYQGDSYEYNLYLSKK